MTLLVLVTVACGSEESLTLQRINYGIVFQQKSDILLAKDSWYHTYEIDFPDTIDIPYLPPCKSNDKSCLVISHVLAQLNNVRTETASKLNNTVESIFNLVPETKIHKSRSRRSLLPFIGKLSKGLFGTATMDDVSILAEHMNKLTKLNMGFTKALSQHEDHLSSYISSANARMDNLMTGIKDNMLAIKFVQSQIFATEATLEQTIDYVMSILIDQIQTTSNLNYELEEFKLGVTDLVNGKLSPLLISEDVVLSTLEDIQAILLSKFPGFYLGMDSVHEVYSKCKFLYARNGTKLYVTLNLPVSSYSKPLQLFKILSLPVPLNSTSDHATQLLDLPEYFAITSDHQYYTTLNAKDLAECTGESTKYCTTNIALYPVTTKSCILALFSNDKTQVISLCDFRFVHNVVKSKIIELSPNSVLLYRTPMLSMQCVQDHKMVPGCDFCVYSLPCKCSISTNDFYFAPRLGSCHKHSNNITVLHPVNLALLQHFFDNSFVNNIFADTTFANKINVTVPVLTLYQHDMLNVIADDSKAHLSLAKMAIAAKNDSLIFQSLTEPLLDGLITLNSKWPSTENILVYTSLAAIVILTIVLLGTMLKVRKLIIIVTTLQNAKRCSAFVTDVPSFVYTHKPSVPEPSSPFSIDLSLDQMNLIILCVISCVILAILLKYFRSKVNAQLCLEISCGKQCVLIDVLHLPLCPSSVEIHTPNSISNLEVRGSLCYPTLYVVWPNFFIKNKLNDNIIYVEAEIPIGWSQARGLSNILRRPFLVQLYKKHKGFLTPLNNWVN